ncbi:MAG: OmpA family protein [Proteobacteria bacterium]|nr:OmpA family protein [Pseudomonadota bacterium]
MKTIGVLVPGLFLSAFLNVALAETTENVYLGFGFSSLSLDGDRVFDVPTRSPGHTPKTVNLLLGYQFNDRWAVDATWGTDITNNVDANQVSINGFRFFGENKWKPFVSAGLSSFGVDDATIDRTEQVQAGFGVSGALSEKLEFRAGYQHFLDFSGESYHDDVVTIGLNWHFGKTKVVPVAQAIPQPESVPKEKEVVDSFELLVQFDFDKTEIKSAYKPQFDQIARVLKESPDISLTVEGHTCWLGSDAYNLGLSEQRSSSVKDMLVQGYDISADRINVVGYGELRPIADNNTQAGREKNRRAIAAILRTRMVEE